MNRGWIPHHGGGVVLCATAIPDWVGMLGAGAAVDEAVRQATVSRSAPAVLALKKRTAITVVWEPGGRCWAEAVVSLK